MSNNLDLELSFTPKAYKDDEGEIRFDPPVYLQRYNHIAAVINSHPAIQANCKKLVDFGCAEMKFFYTVKHFLPTIEHLIEVDIEEPLLIGSQFRVQPLVTDFMNRRNVPLVVEVFCGSVAEPSDVLLGTDVVVAIELIEHLFPETLAGLPANIFGFIQPKIAIFTTPNVEINGIFPRLQGFRHDDHKFEWTRKEFEAWAEDICARYPNYSTKYYGIGPGPEGTEKMGCVSQMVVFLRADMKRLLENPDLELDKPPPATQCGAAGNYKLVATAKYPYDERTKDEKVLDEAKYHITQIERTILEDEENNPDGSPTKIDLVEIYESIKHLVDSSESLQNILVQNGFTVIDGQIHIESIDSWSTSTGYNDDQNDMDEQNFDGNNENNQNTVNVHDCWTEESWD